MKTVSIIVFAVLCFCSLALSAEFYGSVKSNKYHYPSCVWAQRINPSNLVVFTGAEQAVKKGYVPCKVCKPPLP